MSLRRQSRSTGRTSGISSKASVAGQGESANHNDRSRRGKLSLTQREIIQVCATAVQHLGLSNSVGQIFGVIYVSPCPLAFAEVVDCLEISKGSVSQGLRFLRDIGAINQVSVPGDRRELFVPETELRRLISGVLQTRVREPLVAGARRLKEIERLLADSDEPNRKLLAQRLGSLRTWHRKALFVLPLIQGILGPARG
jgi:DNA-binding transcriptional regulator GbsR (MarR family)